MPPGRVQRTPAAARIGGFLPADEAGAMSRPGRLDATWILAAFRSSKSEWLLVDLAEKALPAACSEVFRTAFSFPISSLSFWIFSQRTGN